MFQMTILWKDQQMQGLPNQLSTTKFRTNTKPQTQIHFLNNCTTAINDGQFKWCHDLILKTILFYFTSTNKYDVFGDVERYMRSAVLFSSSIPDIVVLKDNNLYTIEVTVCFETNFLKSWNYKINRSKNLSNKVLGHYAVKKLFLEISSLGFLNELYQTFH